MTEYTRVKMFGVEAKMFWHSNEGCEAYCTGCKGQYIVQDWSDKEHTFCTKDADDHIDSHGDRELFDIYRVHID